MVDWFPVVYAPFLLSSTRPRIHKKTFQTEILWNLIKKTLDKLQRVYWLFPVCLSVITMLMPRYCLHFCWISSNLLIVLLAIEAWMIIIFTEILWREPLFFNGNFRKVHIYIYICLLPWKYFDFLLSELNDWACREFTFI